jgi:hypothetical protein
MSSRPAWTARSLMVEATAAGLAYSAVLCWLSVCAMASFRPGLLSFPYWPLLPNLRSDTSGALAFFAAGVCLAMSEYLRLRRRRSAPAAASPRSLDSPAPFAVAIAETVAVLATGLVAYLSTNAITHPKTLMRSATHLAPWPTEGTLRVVALLGCVCSIAALRYLGAESLSSRAARRAVVAPSSECTCGRGAHDEPVGGGFRDLFRSAAGNGRSVSRVSPVANTHAPDE